MKQSERIKLLLVDDHPFTLQGLRTFLTARDEFDVVGEARDGKEAIEKAQLLLPSVVIMDITMPVMNGLDATRHLRDSAPEVKVLILTAHQANEFTGRVIESGARGCVSKTAPAMELVRAIQIVHRGETCFSTELTDAFVKRILEDSGKPRPLYPPQLSVREGEVIKLIAEGHSNKETASKLGISVRTVEKHRERIMTKLNLGSVAELTKFAIVHELVEMN